MENIILSTAVDHELTDLYDADRMQSALGLMTGISNNRGKFLMTVAPGTNTTLRIASGAGAISGRWFHQEGLTDVNLLSYTNGTYHVYFRLNMVQVAVDLQIVTAYTAKSDNLVNIPNGEADLYLGTVVKSATGLVITNKGEYFTQNVQKVINLKADKSYVDTENTKLKAEDTRLAGLITGVTSVNTTQTTDISNLKTKDTALDGEIAKLKTKDTELDGNISALKTEDIRLAGLITGVTSVNTTQAADITTIKNNYVQKINKDDVTITNTSNTASIKVDSAGFNYYKSGDVSDIANRVFNMNNSSISTTLPLTVQGVNIGTTLAAKADKTAAQLKKITKDTGTANLEIGNGTTKVDVLAEVLKLAVGLHTVKFGGNNTNVPENNYTVGSAFVHATGQILLQVSTIHTGVTYVNTYYNSAWSGWKKTMVDEWETVYNSTGGYSFPMEHNKIIFLNYNSARQTLPKKVKVYLLCDQVGEYDLTVQGISTTSDYGTLAGGLGVDVSRNYGDPKNAKTTMFFVFFKDKVGVRIMYPDGGPVLKRIDAIF